MWPAFDTFRIRFLRGSPSFPALCFLAFFVAVLLTPTLRSVALESADTYLHIRLGQDMLVIHALPRVDSLSYTRAGQTYVGHEWLFELLIATLYRALGTDGVVLFSAFAGAATVWLVVGRALARGAGGLAAATALIPLGLMSWARFCGRPHMVSFMGFAGGLWVLDSGVWRKRSWVVLAATFCVFSLWTNFHSESFMFLGLLGLELAALFGIERSGDARWLALVFLAAAVGTLATPYHIAIPLKILGFLTQPELFRMILEHKPLNRSDGWSALFFLLTLVGLAVFLLRGRRGRRQSRPGELAILVFMAVLTLRNRRHIAPFAITAAALTAVMLQSLIPSRWKPELFRKSDVAWQLACVALAAGLLALRATPLSLEEYLRQTENPIGATRFVREHLADFGPRMYNIYDYGSYLVYALPERRVFIDGRAEFYGLELMKEAYEIRVGNPSAMASLDKWQVDWAMIGTGSPVRWVLTNASWRLAYEDPQTLVFVRPARPKK